MSREAQDTQLTVTETQELLVIAWGRTELCLSATSGTILGVRDRSTASWVCGVTDCPEMSRLFRLVALRRGQRGRAADAHLQASPEWERTADDVAIRYPSLAFEGEAAGRLARGLMDLCIVEDDIAYLPGFTAEPGRPLPRPTSRPHCGRAAQSNGRCGLARCTEAGSDEELELASGCGEQGLPGCQ